jgi:hypothetical protein
MADEGITKGDPTGTRERMRMGPVIILRDPDGTWRDDETDTYNAAMLANQTAPPEQSNPETDPAPDVKT